MCCGKSSKTSKITTFETAKLKLDRGQISKNCQFLAYHFIFSQQSCCASQLSLHMQFYALCSSSNAKKIAHIFKLPITLLGVLKANFFRFSRLSVIIIILLLEKIVHSCFFKLISAALLWLCQTNEKLLKNAPNPVPKRHGGKNTSHVICEKWTSFKKHTFFRCSNQVCGLPQLTHSFLQLCKWPHTRQHYQLYQKCIVLRIVQFLVEFFVVWKW